MGPQGGCKSRRNHCGVGKGKRCARGASDPKFLIQLMGFQLVIAEGKEAGREFVFEQDSVLIGRTSDCDVVLYDPGVSRKHARIFSESDGYFVEDMGSSNGTKVNGAIIKKKQLSDGDAISLGPVVFNFAGLAMLEESTDSQATPAVTGGNTRIVSASDVAARRSKGKGS